jgi:hypothetical protein
VPRNDEYEKSLFPETFHVPGSANYSNLVEDDGTNTVKPSILIPFERDTYQFVAREDVISKMNQLLATHSRVALVGMSGVG